MEQSQRKRTVRRNSNFIASLSHGLSVLEGVADSRGDVALAELINIVGLNKTSVWRLVHTLIELGYLEQDPATRRFRPAPRVLALGYGYFQSLDLKELAAPLLRALSVRLNETVNLAVLDRDELVYIDRVKTTQIVSINLHVGSRLPLYNTSLGRALISEMPEFWLKQYLSRLANDSDGRKYLERDGKKLFDILSETRKCGYSLNDEDLVVGLRSIASPVRDRTGKIVAAINISVPSMRISVSDLRHTFAPELKATADKVSAALGFRGSESAFKAPMIKAPDHQPEVRSSRQRGRVTI